MRRVSFATVAVVLGLAATGAAQVKLEFKHPEGRASTSRSTTKARQVLTINGMDIETNSEEVVTVRSEAGKRRGDGSQPIAKAIESLRSTIETNGQTILSFDSANPGEKPDNPQLAEIYDILKGVVGAKFTAVLDKSGKVAAIEGTESIADDKKDLGDEAKQKLKSRFSAERLKRANQQEYSTFPDLLVREGEPWERTEVMDVGGAMLTFKRKYEYLGTTEQDGKTLDKVGFKTDGVTYETDPDAQTPIKVAKSDLKVEESEGTILFDREAGRAVKKSSKTRIKGDMDLDIQGQAVPSKIDLTLETDVQLVKDSK